MKMWCWSFVGLLLFHSGLAQKKWTGNGGSSYWSDPLNWEGETVPGPADIILLDNSFLSASYEVLLPDTAVEVRSVEIYPAENFSIRLLLPITNTITAPSTGTNRRGFTTTAGGYSILLRKNAEFINASGSNSGYSLRINDSIKIENGAKYIHRTRTGHADLVNQLSRTDGTEFGVFRLENSDAASTVSISARTFGSLELSSSASPTGNCTYSASGTNPVYIRGNLVVEPGTVFSLHFTDTIHVAGSLLLNNSQLNLSTGNRSSCLELKGDLLQENSQILESNLTGNTGTILFNGDQAQSIHSTGQISDSIRLVLNNGHQLRLNADLSIPYELILSRGYIQAGSHRLLLTENAKIEFDPARFTGIEGIVQKRFLNHNRQVLPLIRGGVRSIVSVTDFEGELSLEYQLQDANETGQQMETGLQSVSSMEYWKIWALPDPASGDPVLEFSYSSGHSGTILDPDYLTVAAFNNGQWTAVGNVLAEGSDADSGMVRTVALTRDQLLAGKFALANKTGGPNILPLYLESFWLQQKHHRWFACWKLPSGSEWAGFELEFSQSGMHYQTVASILPSPASSLYTHPLPNGSDQGYCRLKLIALNNSTHYSNVIKVPANKSPDQEVIKLSMQTSSLLINSKRANSYFLEIYNSAGQLMTGSRIYQSAGSATHNIHLPAKKNQWLLIQLRDETEVVASFRRLW